MIRAFIIGLLVSQVYCSTSQLWNANSGHLFFTKSPKNFVIYRPQAEKQNQQQPNIPGVTANVVSNENSICSECQFCCLDGQTCGSYKQCQGRIIIPSILIACIVSILFSFIFYYSQQQQQNQMEKREQAKLNWFGEFEEETSLI